MHRASSCSQGEDELRRFIMKTTLVSSVLLVALAGVFGLTPELAEKAVAVRQQCKDVPKINEAKKEDCHAACFMNGMGYMTNGQINLKNMEEANKQKWDDQDMIKTGILVDTRCTKQVGDTTGKNECTIGFEFITCKNKLVKEMNLQPPTPVKPKN